MGEAESIASSLVPVLGGDSAKNEYLHIRSCGFGIREALALIGKSHRTLRRWRREDAEFLDLERQVPELRKELSSAYLQVQFTRNLVLALKLDERVFQKMINAEDMSRAETAYLNRARATYTPQALESLEKAIRLGQAGEVSFVEIIKQFGYQERAVLERRTTQPVEIENVIEGEVVSRDGD